MDVHDKSTRSYNMSRVRGEHTKPEIAVRQICHGLGFRYRLHRKDLPGKPDLVFPKLRAVILVHGCFWHGHDCALFKMPETRTGFWAEKITGNAARDEYKTRQLTGLGWRVMVVWECALKGRGRLPREEIGERLKVWLLSQIELDHLRGRHLDA